MTVTEFYMYQLGWWVFAVVVAFLCAALFWNKGRAFVRGDLTGSGGITYRLSGAGAIFVVLLGMFWFVNPLKPLSEYNTVLFIHNDETISELPDASNTYPFTIHANTGTDLELDPDTTVVELSPAKYTYTLRPVAGAQRAFATRDAIPKGRYSMYVVDVDTGRTKRLIVDVPGT